MKKLLINDNTNKKDKVKEILITENNSTTRRVPQGYLAYYREAPYA